LNVAILRAGKDDVILATTHEAVRRRRGRESSKKQIIILRRWNRKLTNNLSGTRDLTRRGSCKTRLIHMTEELMELRIELGWAEGQR
jgi:hypothetical protein